MARYKDLTGQRFGRLVVTRLIGKDERKRAMLWECACDCGNMVVVRADSLSSQNTTSCGCYMKDMTAAIGRDRVIDIKGERFTKLLVLERAGSDRHKQALWRCQCDCGNTIIATTSQLRSGHTKSCGCYHADKLKERNTIHGACKTRLYKIWKGMRHRCSCKGDTNYEYYGGRNIRVCSEWDDFIVFRDWAMSHGYVDGLTIDRIDPDKDYHPDNCRWITMSMQANNKRNNHFITINGETHTLSEWSHITGHSQAAIKARIKKGWDESRAVMTPVKEVNKCLLKEMPVVSNS